MADVHDKATRSFNMSQIKGKDTRPEMIVRRYLHARGFRYKLHDRTLPGKPDIVLSKYKTVIFVHGCFWHGHSDCKDYVIPKTRRDWWLNKINNSIKKDEANLKLLTHLGWTVIILWGCELESRKKGDTLEKLVATLSF